MSMSTTGGPGGSGTCIGAGAEPLPGTPITSSEPFALRPHAHTVPSSLRASAALDAGGDVDDAAAGTEPGDRRRHVRASPAGSGRPAYGGTAPHERTVPSFFRISVHWLPDETWRTLPPTSGSGTGNGSIRIELPPSQRICPQARTVPSFMTA